MAIRVDSCLICDDHAMMRAALSGTVALLYPGANCQTAADYTAAVDAAAAMQPSLILCDLAMPGAEPLAGVAKIMAAAPCAALIVVTGSEDDALLLALLAHGVAGFLNKSASAELVEAAIALVVAGGRYLPPRLLTLANGGATLPMRAAGVQPRDVNLTERQFEVLGKIAEGLSNKQIARELALSPATVKTHVAALIAALDASNRTQAVAHARADGLIVG